MRRLDIYNLRRILAEGPLDERVRVLEMWLLELHKWHIFPVKLILPCLQDFDARVRVLAIKILSSLAEFDEYEGRGLIAQWRLVFNPESPLRWALIEGILQNRGNLQGDDIKELVPLLWHPNGDVRSAIMQLFLEVPECFDEVLCLSIVNSASRENLDIQVTISEFMETLGQGHLVADEQGSETGY